MRVAMQVSFALSHRWIPDHHQQRAIHHDAWKRAELEAAQGSPRDGCEAEELIRLPRSGRSRRTARGVRRGKAAFSSG
jgi:hypothetical protein